MRYNVDIDGTICIPGKEKVDILKSCTYQRKDR